MPPKWNCFNWIFILSIYFRSRFWFSIFCYHYFFFLSGHFSFFNTSRIHSNHQSHFTFIFFSCKIFNFNFSEFIHFFLTVFLLFLFIFISLILSFFIPFLIHFLFCLLFSFLCQYWSPIFILFHVSFFYACLFFYLLRRLIHTLPIQISQSIFQFYMW